MYNHYKLTAAYIVGKTYATQLKHHRLTLDAPRYLLAGLLLQIAGGEGDTLNPSLWAYTFGAALPQISGVRYFKGQLEFQLQGHSQKHWVESIPDYRYLVAAAMLCQDYDYSEEPGVALWITTPSGGRRRVDAQGCSCSTYNNHQECDHHRFYWVYTQQRRLFRTYRSR